MGVMMCSREGCYNIMCDTYIQGIGHICEDCKRDFRAQFAPYVVRNGQMPMLLERFMRTEPLDRETGAGIIEEYFKEHTRQGV